MLLKPLPLFALIALAVGCVTCGPVANIDILGENVINNIYDRSVRLLSPKSSPWRLFDEDLSKVIAQPELQKDFQDFVNTHDHFKDKVLVQVPVEEALKLYLKERTQRPDRDLILGFLRARLKNLMEVERAYGLQSRFLPAGTGPSVMKISQPKNFGSSM